MMPSVHTEAYIDDLCAGALITLWWRCRTATRVRYFESTSSAPSFLRVVCRCLFPRCTFERVVFHLSDIRGEDGEGLSIRLRSNDINHAARGIANRFASIPLVRRFYSLFGREETDLYLKHKIEPALRRYLIWVNVIHDHVKHERTHAGPTFHISYYYAEFIREYAQERNIRVDAYRRCGRWARRAARIIRRLLLPPFSIRHIFAGHSRRIDSSRILAVVYQGRDLQPDPRYRTELFWLPSSTIPSSRIAVHLMLAGLPVGEDTFAALRTAGIECVASTDDRAYRGHSVYHPTRRSVPIQSYRWNLRLVLSIIGDALCTGRWTPSFYIDLLLVFLHHYARWRDFFDSNHIRICLNNVVHGEDTIPMHCALKDSGGIHVGYQYSTFMYSGQLAVPICQDVYFAFGPYYTQMLREGSSVIRTIAYSGYITDLTFPLVRQNAAAHREALRRAGADFIVCLFDENSTDEPYGYISNRTSARIYRSFLQALLDDPTLGLILKPKLQRTLLKRIPEIRPLLENAISTGRCLLLGDDDLVVSRIQPTEAAQAADVTVGPLIGGTTVLESYLSGVKSVYLDTERLYTQPEYRWEHPVVFNDPDEVLAAIRRYRRQPDAYPNFGNLSVGADRIPYRDGKAAIRLSGYLSDLIRGFDDCLPRERCIQQANENFRARWGPGSIAEFSPTTEPPKGTVGAVDNSSTLK